MEIEKEYERIKALYNGCDENQLKLLDGVFWEAARLRKELDDSHKIVKKTGKIKVHPDDFTKQKKLLIADQLTKDRANYLNYMSKLSSLLGKNTEEDDDDLDDYE